MVRTGSDSSWAAPAPEGNWNLELPWNLIFRSETVCAGLVGTPRRLFPRRGCASAAPECLGNTLLPAPWRGCVGGWGRPHPQVSAVRTVRSTVTPSLPLFRLPPASLPLGVRTSAFCRLALVALGTLTRACPRPVQGVSSDAPNNPGLAVPSCFETTGTPCLPRG